MMPLSAFVCVAVVLRDTLMFWPPSGRWSSGVCVWSSMWRHRFWPMMAIADAVQGEARRANVSMTRVQFIMGVLDRRLAARVGCAMSM